MIHIASRDYLRCGVSYDPKSTGHPGRDPVRRCPRRLRGRPLWPRLGRSQAWSAQLGRPQRRSRQLGRTTRTAKLGRSARIPPAWPATASPQRAARLQWRPGNDAVTRLYRPAATAPLRQRLTARPASPGLSHSWGTKVRPCGPGNVPTTIGAHTAPVQIHPGCHVTRIRLIALTATLCAVPLAGCVDDRCGPPHWTTRGIIRARQCRRCRGVRLSPNRSSAPRSMAVRGTRIATTGGDRVLAAGSTAPSIEQRRGPPRDTALFVPIP